MLLCGGGESLSQARAAAAVAARLLLLLAGLLAGAYARPKMLATSDSSVSLAGRRSKSVTHDTVDPTA